MPLVLFFWHQSFVLFCWIFVLPSCLLLWFAFIFLVAFYCYGEKHFPKDFIYFSLDVLYCADSAVKSCNCLGSFVLEEITYSFENIKNAGFSHFVLHKMNGRIMAYGIFI